MIGVKEDDFLAEPKTTANQEQKDLLLDLENRLVPYMRAFGFGADNRQQIEGIRKTLRKVALFAHSREKSPLAATEFAFNILAKRFDVLSTSNAQLLISKELGLTPFSSVIGAPELELTLDLLRSRDRLEKFKPFIFDQTRDRKTNDKIAILNASALGIWTANEDATGVILLHSFDVSGGTNTVINEKGERYTFTWDEILELRNRKFPVKGLEAAPTSPGVTASISAEVGRTRLAKAKSRKAKTPTLARGFRNAPPAQKPSFADVARETPADLAR